MPHVRSITDAPLDGSGLARIRIISWPHSSLNEPKETAIGWQSERVPKGRPSDRDGENGSVERRIGGPECAVALSFPPRG